MIRKIIEGYKEQGRQEMLSKVLEKFAELHDDYYSQGDEAARNLIVDLVAYIQDDYEALEDITDAN